MPVARTPFAAPRNRYVLLTAAHTLLFAIIAMAALLLAPSASAHDTLVSASPAKDGVVDAASTEAALTFSAELLDQPTSLVVTGAAGKVVAEGAANVQGHAVTPPLRAALPDREYQVTSSGVSSDGHRTQDADAVTVAAGGGQSAAAEEPATENPSADSTTSEPQVAQAPEQDASENPSESDSWMPSWSTILLVQAGILVVAVAAALTYRWWTRR